MSGMSSCGTGWAEVCAATERGAAVSAPTIMTAAKSRGSKPEYTNLCFSNQRRGNVMVKSWEVKSTADRRRSTFIAV
jgi:hypothetical protein